MFPASAASQRDVVRCGRQLPPLQGRGNAESTFLLQTTDRRLPRERRSMSIHPSFRDTPKGAGPESRAGPSRDWIPGSRFTRPGVTKRRLRHVNGGACHLLPSGEKCLSVTKAMRGGSPTAANGSTAPAACLTGPAYPLPPSTSSGGARPQTEISQIVPRSCWTRALMSRAGSIRPISSPVPVITAAMAGWLNMHWPTKARTK